MERRLLFQRSMRNLFPSILGLAVGITAGGLALGAIARLPPGDDDGGSTSHTAATRRDMQPRVAVDEALADQAPVDAVPPSPAAPRLGPMALRARPRSAPWTVVHDPPDVSPSPVYDVRVSEPDPAPAARPLAHKAGGA
jgi:hypothetical protein